MGVLGLHVGIVWVCEFRQGFIGSLMAVANFGIVGGIAVFMGLECECEPRCQRGHGLSFVGCDFGVFGVAAPRGFGLDDVGEFGFFLA